MNNRFYRPCLGIEGESIRYIICPSFEICFTPGGKRQKREAELVWVLHWYLKCVGPFKEWFSQRQYTLYAIQITGFFEFGSFLTLTFKTSWKRVRTQKALYIFLLTIRRSISSATKSIFNGKMVIDHGVEKVIDLRGFITSPKLW